MKKYISISFLLLAVVVLFTQCSKKNEEPTNNEVIVKNGTYTGYYHRTNMDTAQITLTVNNGNFSGTSNLAYPVICNGSFVTGPTTLRVTNNCNNSGVDNPVLTGDYDYFFYRENTFKMWRTVNNIYEEYLVILNN